MKKIFAIFFAIAVLAVAGTTIYARWFTNSEQRFTGTLKKIVPAEIPGWKIEEIPLAETAGARENVEKVLKFDQVVSRKFSKNGLEITFYAAYWKPGTRSPVDAGGHNPDSCWVNFGWTRTQREFSVAGTTLGNRELQPYEFGVYEKDGHEISAIFWHLLNGKPHSYEDKRDGWSDGISGVIFRLPKRIEDLKKLGLNQRREQLFIRISFAGQSFSEILKNPDFEEFMLKIDELGIFADKTWANEASGTPKIPENRGNAERGNDERGNDEK